MHGPGCKVRTWLCVAGIVALTTRLYEPRSCVLGTNPWEGPHGNESCKSAHNTKSSAGSTPTPPPSPLPLGNWHNVKLTSKAPPPPPQKRNNVSRPPPPPFSKAPLPPPPPLPTLLEKIPPIRSISISGLWLRGLFKKCFKTEMVVSAPAPIFAQSIQNEIVTHVSIVRSCTACPYTTRSCTKCVCTTCVCVTCLCTT